MSAGVSLGKVGCMKTAAPVKPSSMTMYLRSKWKRQGFLWPVVSVVVAWSCHTAPELSLRQHGRKVWQTRAAHLMVTRKQRDRKEPGRTILPTTKRSQLPPNSSSFPKMQI